MVNDLLHFLDESPTAYLATEHLKQLLIEAGYQKLDRQKIEKGGKYYLTRNDSGIIALNVGKRLNEPALHIAASHTDCPVLKLKPEAVIKGDNSISLGIEEYGGLLKRTWFDRPLALAGRVVISEKDRICSRIFKDEEAFCIIPSMARHLDKEIEDKKIEASKDLVPIVTMEKEFDLKQYLADRLQLKALQIMGYDLYLYPVQKASRWGQKKEFITSHHLDNLECAYLSLRAFIDRFHDDNINIYASFDNEEVGSKTRQGADSDFLKSIIDRLCRDLDLYPYDLLQQGFLLSCDNAHALHPNYPELYDRNNAPKLNQGIVLKYNASQSYCTDAVSAAIMKQIWDQKKIPYQIYANKTGIRGGSTLGNISNSQVSLLSADVGLAQWAMHSSIETAGAEDVQTMVDAVSAFYDSHIHYDGEAYTVRTKE
ncbi:MAG: M18 family aminopeptidase [Erysipelotrichaceae bacterium]|nr:M18 family aminopeptidase [Erysipelotrichaceae bacterium]